MGIFKKIKSIIAKSSNTEEKIEVKNVERPSVPIQYGILSTNVQPISADFTKGYVPSMAEDSKFIVADTTSSFYHGYPSNGFGKYVQLAHIIPSLEAVDFSKGYNPGMAENGKFVELKLDPSLGWPQTNYPKYAVLTYIVNPDAIQLIGGTLSGSLNLSGFDIFNVDNFEANFIEASCGNSEDWCSSYTTVCANSSTWNGNFCSKIILLSGLSACPNDSNTIQVYSNLNLNGFSISGIGNDSLTFESSANIKSDMLGSVYINASRGDVYGGALGFYAASGQTQGGWVEIFAGETQDNNGSDITIRAGETFAGEAYGGSIFIESGFAEFGARGDVTIDVIGSSSSGKVYINGDTDVTGNIDATGIVYASCGNSNEWCQTYNKSGKWDSVYTQVSANSAIWSAHSIDVTAINAQTGPEITITPSDFININSSLNTITIGARQLSASDIVDFNESVGSVGAGITAINTQTGSDITIAKAGIIDINTTINTITISSRQLSASDIYDFDLEVSNNTTVNGTYTTVNQNSAIWGGSGIVEDWTLLTTFSSLSVDGDWQAVTYGNGLFVAVADGSNDDYAMVSDDGINWRAVTLPAGGINNYKGVTYGNGIFVAVSEDDTGAPPPVPSNQFATSVDGYTWTAQSAPLDKKWRDVAYGKGKFIAVAQNNNDNVAISYDGKVWTTVTGAQNNAWQSITYGNGEFVACASQGNDRVQYSSDGINWTTTTGANGGAWYGATYGNGVYVVVGGSGPGSDKIAYSTDGINFTVATNGVPVDSARYTSVIYGERYFIAVSDQGTILGSPDGINWELKATISGSTFRSIAFGNGVFVAVSDSGVNRVVYSGKHFQREENSFYLFAGDQLGSGNLTVTDDISAGSFSLNYTITSWNEIVPPPGYATESWTQTYFVNASGDSMTGGLTAPTINANTIYSSCGNSDQWCSVYTIVSANSANWLSNNTIKTEIVATSFTINASSGIVLIDASSGPTIINIPDATVSNGKRYTVKKIDGTNNNVTLSASTNIDGQDTYIINKQYDAIEFISNGIQWWII